MKMSDSSHRYKKSEELLVRAEKSIPLGTQTFSKSRTQFPYGISPYFIKKGEGSRVWDVDGNEYIDFVNALAAITLGHNDPDVSKAVKAQMDNGTIFSLAHPIEMEVAEKIIEMVPCVEQVRFGKNGSDATAGAIRLARAFTGKEHVLVCGYHGWQDWYIGSTPRNLGVPYATRTLTHTFEYNNLDSLKKLFEELGSDIAAVMLEPMNIIFPEKGFLEGVKALTHEHNALLIFDEVVTGFRNANGGAQEYFGVTPDLVCLGKGLANGYPLSAIGGRAEIMKMMEEVYFSFTYGGETLSLAAALASLNKLQTHDVINQMSIKGQRLLDEVSSSITAYELDEVLSVSGHPTWSFLLIKDHKDFDAPTIKTFFMQEMMENGILTLGSHLLSYAHTDDDIDSIIDAYKLFLERLSLGLKQKKLLDMLKCEPIRPLFKVRKDT